jgi:hypothetical protein
MKILLHMSVALALALTLVSGLCVGCVESSAEHKCCHETEQAPSCHHAEPSQTERCDCPDTGRILAAAVEAKQTVKQQIQPAAVLGTANVPGIEAMPVAGGFSPARPIVLPRQDLLSLNSILRI